MKKITKSKVFSLWEKHGELTQEDTAKKLNVGPKRLRTVEDTPWIQLKHDYMDLKVNEVPELPVASGTVVSPDKTRSRLSGKRFVFTSAQNNTFIHEDFFASLLKYCELNEAQLVIGRFSYNKKGYQRTKGDDKLWYDNRIEQYVLDESAVVTEGLVWCGELDILPTAVRPTSGYLSYTQAASGIIPHAKLQMQPCAVLFGQEPKFLYTTGAITQRNYIDRSTGQKAAFHHVFSALIAEVGENGWFVRQLVANEEGVFHDLEYKYTPEGREKVAIASINWGDLHAEKVDPFTMAGSWGEGGNILDTLRPQYQFVHDSTDFAARNHHNLKSPYFLHEMLVRGTGSVEGGLSTTAEVLSTMHRPWCQTVIVASNHDEAFKRWLLEADVRFDPENVRFWHQMNFVIHTMIDRKIHKFDPYAWWMNKLGVKAVFLAADQSFKVREREKGMHGHMGISGSRGGVLQFRGLNTKVDIGHVHAAWILDGVNSAGLSGTMDMGYNRGPGMWSASHVITYDNGKNATLTMRGPKWRA